MPKSQLGVRPHPGSPLVVAYGLGVDSTAMLVRFARNRIRPDLILFADTGGEKPETYQYLDVIRPFLAQVRFPDVIVVRYRPRWAAYKTLEEQCLHTGTLPSLAYGGRSCSMKYKVSPQDKFVKGWPPAQECWRRGAKVLKAIGFDAGPADSRRHRFVEDKLFTYWYPLVEWGFDRERCKQIIVEAGLPVPMKSACFFCPAMKKQEIVWLQEQHPELLERALAIQRNAQAKLISVRGLGRSFAWGTYLRQRIELPLFPTGGDDQGV
jgi:hypothetical protein